MSPRLIILIILLAGAVITAIGPARKGKQNDGIHDLQETLLSDMFHPHYTGEVIPTPQKAQYFDTDSDLTTARILISGNAETPLRHGVREIADRISVMGGTKPQIEEKPELPRHAAMIQTAPVPTNIIRRLWETKTLHPPKHKEGYTLSVVETADKGAIFISGKDALGAFWGCQSLLQLLRTERGRVLCRNMKIVDFPAFEIRSFKIGGSHTAVETLGMWCPAAKFNTFNICYTSMGLDKWSKPDQRYLRLLDRLTEHLLPRGVDVMMFINPYFAHEHPFQIANDADLEKLIDTSSLGLKKGCRKVMLCLDDFASKPQAGPRLFVLSDETDRHIFHDDLSRAHIHLLNHWHRHLKGRFPRSELFTVPSYYWTPSGAYRQDAERYLRHLGRSVPKTLNLVWTGPYVRSTVITQKDIEAHTARIGRKPFLWDNTIYASHDPPDYFLDLFKTVYPEIFWKLINKGCHYNAGATEAYRVGLLCIADYLWNPEAYNPDISLRKAIRVVAGNENEAVNPLIEFRDIYYQLREKTLPLLLKCQDAAIKRNPAHPSAGGKDCELTDAENLFTKGDRLVAEIASRCFNQGLVREAITRWANLSAIRHDLLYDGSAVPIMQIP